MEASAYYHNTNGRLVATSLYKARLSLRNGVALDLWRVVGYEQQGKQYSQLLIREV